MKLIGVIGAGNMGAALIQGLAASGKARAQDMRVFDVDESKARQLEKKLGITYVSCLEDTVSKEVRTLVLAVKPQILEKVLKTIAEKVHDGLMIVSIAAGISTDYILSCLNRPARVIRVMPNAAAMVGAGASALCKAGTADDTDMSEALDLFSAVGMAVPVEEKMMSVVTALSGSGPGYLFPMMEAFVDGAVLLGLDRPTAKRLLVQTFMGAAAMAAAEDVSFSELKDRITSPGGTTIAALRVLERSGLRGILMDAMIACARRSEELSGGK